MDLTTGNQLADAIVGLFIIIGGGGGVMKLKRLGLINFGKGNGNSKTFTRKEFMSKESKKEFDQMKKDNKLLQSKEMCDEIAAGIKKDIKEMKSAQRYDSKVLLSIATQVKAVIPPPSIDEG